MHLIFKIFAPKYFTFKDFS